jgi:hypothetical protein
MISKKLLSEVLKTEFKRDYEFSYIGDNSFLYTDEYIPINGYEIAHKCKEWAISKGYIIETSYESITDSFGAYCICRVYFDGDKVYDNYSEDQPLEKEPEAIFQATQWILEIGNNV